MIPYVGSSVTKDHVRVVTIIQNSCAFDVKGQRILKPEVVIFGMLPSVGRVSIQSMDCDDAV